MINPHHKWYHKHHWHGKFHHHHPWYGDGEGEYTGPEFEDSAYTSKMSYTFYYHGNNITMIFQKEMEKCMKCLNKKNILMILLIIYFISYSSALTFFSKKVLLEESKEIDILITSFYESLENKNFDLVEELFYDKKINILIESNKIMENYNNSKYLGRINNINDISKYFLLTELTGKKISESIVSKDFVSQPYDYPIGNIFYVKVSNEYEKKVINDYFFIIKDENSFKIYELKKIILPQI